MLKAVNLCPNDAVTFGIVVVRGLRVGPSCAEQEAELRSLVESRSGGASPEIRAAVRRMLKKGGFSPNGRNRPSSEYLLKVASAGEFPEINNAVDVINYFSLMWGIPVSLLDLDVVGDRIELRIASAGEGYVFNRSGQILNLSGLVAVYGDGYPLGAPVKDSMAGKITDSTRNAVAVIYAPSERIDRLTVDGYCRDLAKKMRKYAKATETAVFIL